ncbi:MAG: DNA recombination protein RmuC [Chlamydiia bacterium]|nr:DNA recombination protein RmuC [Chlamydiia bacterium]
MILLLISMNTFALGLLCGWFLSTVRKKKLFKHKELAEELLRNNNASFLELAKETLATYHEKATAAFEKKEVAVASLVKPVRESLDKVDTKIAELEKARVGAYASLRSQVEGLCKSQEALRRETNSLVRALRQPVVRGRWGEIQLKRVVELAGMLDHCDFYEQESVTNEEGRFRPDLLVRLPGDKNIIVDAKAPLDAFLDAIDCEDEGVRKGKLIAHARQIRSHMVQLSRKSYWDQFQRTPEFVVLFLPGETFFSAALEYDPSLIEGGVNQQVILATPTTLIALLRAVAYGWQQEHLSESAEQISQLGKELYKRLSDLGGHFSKLGRSLGASVAAYNKAVGTLENRVLVSARRFKDLAPTSADKELETMDPIEHVPRNLVVGEVASSDDCAEII